MTDEELKELVASLAISQKETDRQIQETGRKIRELRERQEETDRLMRERDEKTAQEMRKLQESQKETGRQIRALGKQIGDIDNRLGEFVVEMIQPCALDLFNQKGILVEEIHTGVKIRRGGYRSDIDLMLVNGHELVAIEIKSAFKIDHLFTHIERLQQIRNALPHYAGYTIFGGIGSMVMPDEVRERGVEEGLFVILPKGEHLTLANGEDFRPKAW